MVDKNGEALGDIGDDSASVEGTDIFDNLVNDNGSLRVPPGDDGVVAPVPYRVEVHPDRESDARAKVVRGAHPSPLTNPRNMIAALAHVLTPNRRRHGVAILTAIIGLLVIVVKALE